MAGMRDNLRVGMDRLTTVKPVASSKLIRRDLYLQSSVDSSATFLSLAVPDEARFIVARGIAAGGDVLSSTQNGAGGGGGYFKHYFSVRPGETIRILVGQGLATQIKRGETLICQAEKGGVGTGTEHTFGDGLTWGGKGGKATGSITSTGSDGSYLPKNFGSFGNSQIICEGGSQPGEGPQQPIRTIREMIDTFNIEGKGAQGVNARPASGFGGGATKLNGGYRGPTGGVLILEYYTSDPR